MEVHNPEAIDIDATQPPVSVLRYDSPTELYLAMPQIRELTQLRPTDEESHLTFLDRLSSSSTPEEIVTFTAFAARPKVAVWWGYECLRNLRSDFSSHDRVLLEKVAAWCSAGNTATRYEIMQIALFAQRRTAAVQLGLAVGWAGPQIAPNDPAPIAPHRTPRGVNAAVLSALAQCHLGNRWSHMAKLRRLAESIFRAY